MLPHVDIWPDVWKISKGLQKKWLEDIHGKRLPGFSKRFMFLHRWTEKMKLIPGFNLDVNSGCGHSRYQVFLSWTKICGENYMKWEQNLGVHLYDMSRIALYFGEGEL